MYHGIACREQDQRYPEQSTFGTGSEEQEKSRHEQRDGEDPRPELREEIAEGAPEELGDKSNAVIYKGHHRDEHRIFEDAVEHEIAHHFIHHVDDEIQYCGFCSSALNGQDGSFR